MKRFIKLLVSFFLIVVIAFTAVVFYGTRGLDKVSNIEISGFDVSNIQDGEYKGEFEYGRWSNTVLVTVDSNKISDIKIVEDVKFAQPDVSKEILTRVIDAQNTKVDVVTGATVTSKAYLKSIENALTNQ